jgi:hypothetical protein
VCLLFLVPEFWKIDWTLDWDFSEKCAVNCVLDIVVGASDAAKWSGRSVWWRLGCGGLVLSFVLDLDVCAELFLWMLFTGLIFLVFVKGSFLFLRF